MSARGPDDGDPALLPAGLPAAAVHHVLPVHHPQRPLPHHLHERLGQLGLGLLRHRRRGGRGGRGEVAGRRRELDLVRVLLVEPVEAVAGERDELAEREAAEEGAAHQRGGRLGSRAAEGAAWNSPMPTSSCSVVFFVLLGTNSEIKSSICSVLTGYYKCFICFIASAGPSEIL